VIDGWTFLRALLFGAAATAPRTWRCPSTGRASALSPATPTLALGSNPVGGAGSALDRPPSSPGIGTASSYSVTVRPLARPQHRAPGRSGTAAGRYADCNRVTLQCGARARCPDVTVQLCYLCPIGGNRVMLTHVCRALSSVAGARLRRGGSSEPCSPSPPGKIFPTERRGRIERAGERKARSVRGRDRPQDLAGATVSRGSAYPVAEFELGEDVVTREVASRHGTHFGLGHVLGRGQVRDDF
jgi:hypothetical protein